MSDVDRTRALVEGCPVFSLEIARLIGAYLTSYGDLTVYKLAQSIPSSVVATTTTTTTTTTTERKAKEFYWSVLSCVCADSIMCCYVHPVTFQMMWKDLSLTEFPLADMLTNKFELDEESPSALVLQAGARSFISRMLPLGWDAIVFPHAHLLVWSRQNGNDDVRGGGCGGYNIPVADFRYTIENQSGITLRNLTEAIYRMKGSKYDYGYEMYVEFDVTRCGHDTVEIEVGFGYGS
jgi:hypothetical protein